MCIYIYIYVYIYIYIQYVHMYALTTLPDVITFVPLRVPALAGGPGLEGLLLCLLLSFRPVHLLRVFLLRVLESELFRVELSAVIVF